MQDGLDLPSETDLRILGCELIQAAGILLRLPQVAMATGQVLFHRFFYSKSFVKHSFEIVAMACINLASKIEEAPRRIRDVINVFHHLRQLRGKRTPSPLILDQNYINTKNQVIKAERRVLKELGFCVHVKHPHKIIVMYLQVLECERNQTLVQTAWNYMNDSLRTNVFVRFQPETIACACIYLAARALQIPLPTRPHWFLLFGTTEEEIQEICIETLRLYTRKKPNYELLEKEVEKRKVALQEAKLKAKGLNPDGTPALSTLGGFSPASKPSSPREVKTEEKSPISVNVKTIKKEPEDRQQASKSPYNGVGVGVGVAKEGASDSLSVLVPGVHLQPGLLSHPTTVIVLASWTQVCCYIQVLTDSFQGQICKTGNLKTNLQYQTQDRADCKAVQHVTVYKQALCSCNLVSLRQPDKEHSEWGFGGKLRMIEGHEGMPGARVTSR
ncbi:hypothetical protein E5288_WYG006396 [Bos mutus]|uniref:Uncharacterized protein n=1 Tax=Bos mutus TaxID=72004 RepID=A0A6B0QTK8_9CETA|nr:hypothetical protein [Bos mutus]